MTSRANTGSTAITSTDKRIDKAILWITLGSLFMIPLLFSYFQIVAVYSELRVALLHLAAGSVATLWLWQVVLVWYQDEGKKRQSVSWDLMDWVRSNPARWTVVALAIFVFVQVASTLLSPLPIISFFGGDDARSGYNLYDSLSLTVLLFTVAFRLRSERKLELLAYTLVISGTIAAIYGTAQHFGWDPIGENGGRVRAIASFGNTLNFGAYMVMSIPATMAVWHLRTKRPPLWMAAITLALGIQIAGIWFAGGRGPFAGAAAGILIYFAIALILLPRRDTLRIIGASVAASVIATIIVALPSPTGDVGLARVLSIGDQLSGGDTTSTDIQGGLTGRFSIWKSTLKLATRWDMPIDEPTANSLLRPVFGVGPDMLVYAFPYVGEPQSELSKVDHAHNLGLNTLAELGYLGLISLAAVSAFLLYTGFRTVVMARFAANGVNKTSIVILAILPSLFGKLIEAQTGVPRVSDMAMMFALTGAAIALYEIVRRLSPAGEQSTSNSATSSTTITTSRPVFVGSMLLAAVVVSAVFVTMFLGWDVRRISASRHLAINHDNPDQVIATLAWQNAQAQAPERDSLTLNLSQEFMKAVDQQKAIGEDDLALDGLLYIRDMLLEYEQRDPFHIDAQIGLAQTATKMTEWGYTEYAQEMSDRYIRIVELSPNFPSLAGTAATAMASVGLHDLAIEFADRAIATEATTKPWAKAWYAKGRSLYELGRDDEAIPVLVTATEKEPDSDGATLAHQVLADLYQDRGDAENYEIHNLIGSRPLTGR
jgi:tetratricopeptide (TPR) repeat protein